ncbi:MAG TPA: DUF5103 domain-containing protein [Flavisolibacter sp.]|jgi:hypothetical protein|nr:DUF5103 domain-containing protein [Flavisolibacter sp.]
MKRILIVFACIFSVASVCAQDLVLNPNIKTVKLYRTGDQTSFPIVFLNSTEGLELHFDDLDNRVKNYYYTFQLCNADWSPSILHPYEYIKGFQNVRITNYRNSSLSTARYVHYQANVPDRSCYPSRSGNYLLKVFLDNDTSKLVFVKRMVVGDNRASVAAQVLQPFNSTLYRTGQKINVVVQTDNRIQVMSPNDLKIVILQNNNWQTSVYMDRPTIYRGNYYEYSDEAYTGFPAAKEFRWIDLRSLRLKSDRMLDIDTHKDTTDVTVIPDPNRSSQIYVYYRDLNGSYTIETLESINPFWQGDYAVVHFSYFPPNNKPFPGNDLYLFGEFTNWASDTSGKMEFNKERGAYEKTIFLKQGFYNYLYALKSPNSKNAPDFSQTEGNYYGTENSYIVLVYYRPFGARADEVIAYTSLNSNFR